MSIGPQNLAQLAQAQAATAEAVLATVQANAGGLNDGASLVQAVAQMTQGARAFRDCVLGNQPLVVITQAYDQMDPLAGQINQYFSANPAPPQVQAAWQAFAAIELQTADAIRAAGAGQVAMMPGAGYPPAGVGVGVGGGPSPVAGLADQLVGETTAFIANFAPTAGRVPEGRYMLAEAQQLQSAAANFRQSAFTGLPPDQLAYAFSQVGACWQQLGSRVERIAQGHMGPNIAQVQKLGMICGQIGQSLGVPGY